MGLAMGCALAGGLAIAMLVPFVFHLAGSSKGRPPAGEARFLPGIPPPSKDAVAWPTCGGSAKPPLGVSPVWRGADDFAAALQEQDATGAPLLIYVRTDWCQYCAAFDRVLADPRLNEHLSRQVVKVRINPENGAAAARLSALLGVEGYPSLFLISPLRGVSEISWRESPAEFLLEVQQFTQWQIDSACWSRGRG